MDTDAIRMPAAKRLVTSVNKRRYQPVVRNIIEPQLNPYGGISLIFKNEVIGTGAGSVLHCDVLAGGETITILS